jgi:hypothetical protein
MRVNNFTIALTARNTWAVIAREHAEFETIAQAEMHALGLDPVADKFEAEVSE